MRRFGLQHNDEYIRVVVDHSRSHSHSRDLLVKLLKERKLNQRKNQFDRSETRRRAKLGIGS